MNRLIGLTLAAGLLLAPSRASAHARVTRSVPADGSRLRASPPWIQLWFSERPELSMTFGQMKRSDGKLYQLGAATRSDSAELGIDFQVQDSLPPGQYVLSWRTAASDGHPTHGKLAFEVLPSADAVRSADQAVTIDSLGDKADSVTAGSSSAQSIAPDARAGSDDAAASTSNSLLRAFLFAGILLLVGTITFTLIVLRRASSVSEGSRELMMHRSAFLGISAAAVVATVALLRLRFELEMMQAMPDMPGMIGVTSREMVLHTTWGFAFILQLAGSVVALVAFIFAARRVRWAWNMAALAALVVAMTPALSGHAAAAPRFTALMVTSDWLHVLGAASWLGTLVCLMAIGVPLALKQQGDERWNWISSLVNEFSRLALVSVGTVVVSGIFATWMHVARLSDLWSTTYGWILLAKLTLVAVTLAIGAYNFKRVQPQLAVERGTVRLRKSATLELATGFLILLVTGFLTGVSP